MIQQVEFNTISSSFGSLSTLAGQLHRYLATATDGYYGTSPLLKSPTSETFPKSQALEELTRGLAEGWKAYGKAEARILFVVQAGERNVFDQRWLEWKLMEE